GRFVVLAAAYSGTGALTSFAANFEQHCEGAAPALWGEIRINSSVPFTHAKPAGSTQPDPMAFAPARFATPGAQVASSSSTFYGINAPISVTVAGGEYSINGGAYTSAPGFASNRDHVRVRGLAPATGSQ